MTQTAFSLLGPAEFQQGVLGLLPRGRAWPRRITSLLAAVAGGIGDAFAQFHAVVVNFLDVESDPTQAVALLPEWNTDYGLPDSCSPANPTTAQQQASLAAKIAATGGQSAVYFIGIAANLGVTITITTWDAWTCWDSPWLPITDQRWRFAWQINAPVGSTTEVSCRLGKLGPAYGVTWTVYS